MLWVVLGIFWVAFLVAFYAVCKPRFEAVERRRDVVGDRELPRPAKGLIAALVCVGAIAPLAVTIAVGLTAAGVLAGSVVLAATMSAIMAVGLRAARVAQGRRRPRPPDRLDFFVYSRDAAGTPALRDDQDLLEEHWSYMDGFADSMIARGPTLGTDRESATGSLHVLGLPGVEAAHEFVAREPNHRAGVYAEHFVWRFENLLGRTMWEFSGEPGEPRFLIIARSRGGSGRPVPLGSLSAELRERLILYGALRALDDAALVGVALAVQARDRAAVDALLEGFEAFDAVEIHDWEFGGRR